MISVIIPTLNEEHRIADLIKYLNEHGQGLIEIIIVDGGSTDKTTIVALAEGAKVVNSPEKGRAKQMNFGANLASFEILYFLHADTNPPVSFVDEIMNANSDGWNAGCFRLSFDNKHPLLSFYSWFTRLNIDVFRFGDQSLFVEKQVFNKAGTFDEKLIIMEDQEIVRSIKKVSNFKILDCSVVTSARKYEKIGFIKLQLIFTTVLTMYYFGVDQKKILDYYFRKIQ